MAHVIPHQIPSTSTAGEKRLFGLLQRLPEDWIVYYEPSIGGRSPDFVVLSPDLGILVIEDKNWRPSTILSGDRKRVRIRTPDGGTKMVTHPEVQARGYNERIRQVAEKNRWGRALLHAEGSYEGGLIFPVGHVVSLSNITRSQLESGPNGLGLIFDPERTVTRDDLERWDALSAAELQEALRSCFSPSWAFPRLSDDQIKAARLLIHPEIELTDQFSTDSLLEAPRPLSDRQDILRVLDEQQESCARSIGEGHRILFGVAGSGKTMILLTRARLLAMGDPDAEILLVCYNRLLAEWMGRQLAAFPQVRVMTFHAWGMRSGVPFSRSQRDDEFGEAILNRLRKGRKDTAAYDAILVDEAQDFEPNWFRCLLAAMKDPENGDLLIVADGAQGLYRRSRISWSQLGIQARGRTHSKRFELDRNYRNTREVLSLAETFATRTAPAGEDAEDGILSLRVNPRQCVRDSGASPLLLVEESEEAEIDAAIRWVGELLAGRWGGREMTPLRPEEIGILYPRSNSVEKKWLEALPGRLRKELGVAGTWLNGSGTLSGSEGISIQTIHSAKGLQFRAVAVLWVGKMPGRFSSEPHEETEISDRRLLYVAMTRAESFLALTASRASSFVKELKTSPACEVREGERRPDLEERVG